MITPAGPGTGLAALRGQGRALAGALALALLLASACTAQGGPAARARTSRTARLADCGQRPQVRPDVLAIICSDSGIIARDLHWSSWGKPVATAVGTAVVNLCELTDCHTGSYRPYPIVLVASRLSACPGGWRGYTRLQYLFVGRQPFPHGNPAPDKQAPRNYVRAQGTVPGVSPVGCG